LGHDASELGVWRETRPRSARGASTSTDIERLNNITMKTNQLTTIVVAILAIATAPIAQACSRILWNGNKLAVLVGRTMDWPESTEPILTVLPQGMQRDGGMAGTEQVVKENAAKWTSKHGSLVTTIYGIGTADGLNEKGLAGHMLYLNATNFGPRDPGKAGVHAGLWLQYLLDNAADVKEALALLAGVQIVMVSTHGHNANVHLAIEDASGDSAIIEFIKGKQVVHHGREYRLMTNDPTYDEQLALLKQHDFSKPSSDLALPGNVKATDRFQRAAYFSAMLPEPKSEREAVASVLAVARNVSVPFGAPYKDFGIYNTEYRTAINLTGRRYFFELTTSPNVLWADLTRFDLSPGSAVLTLNPDDLGLSGDVTGRFQKVSRAPF
jgi:penicillin V acylase-like amidase (Ntn superfamily)